MKALYRSQLVYINLTNANALTGAFVPFPDQPSLNGVYLMGIEAMGADTLLFTPGLTPTVTRADEELILVTLNEGSNQRHKQMPMVQLDPFLTFGIWKEVVPFHIDWQKSGILVTSPLHTAVLSVPFLIHYATPEDLGLAQ